MSHAGSLSAGGLARGARDVLCAWCSEEKDKNRKKQEEKKKNAPKKVPGGQPQGGAVKMGKAGGAVIQPGRSSAPGKKSTR